MEIEPFETRHQGGVVRLSLRAWAPVFESIEAAMDAEVYRELYPDGWRTSQQRAVEATCASEEMAVWVARDADAIVGFVAVKLDDEAGLGEVHMIAVDPDHQRRGIGTALTEFALDQMRLAGMSVAMVETGGDPGHGPARRTYEGAGFGLLPISRYFKKL